MQGINPYVRLRVADEAPLFAQKGKVYSETGPAIPMDEVPEWCWEAYGAIPATRRKVFGLELPSESSNAKNLRTSKKRFGNAEATED